VSSRERLDVLVARRGLAPSRERARRMILAGLVRVEGRLLAHVGAQVASDAAIEVVSPDHPFVSRGGVKLAAALDDFAIDPSGRICADIGASTGGFTDCLLQRGAACVHAVDVGYGQLAWKLRTDPRVRVHERTNVRTMAPGTLQPPASSPSCASFIRWLPDRRPRSSPARPTSRARRHSSGGRARRPVGGPGRGGPREAATVAAAGGDRPRPRASL
jgi:23S rRNA (cytidine1920-2'-O)/16S rRNA (cytidine1409-2'-O)-methyltransferase